jgi:hypothetical protein
MRSFPILFQFSSIGPVVLQPNYSESIFALGREVGIIMIEEWTEAVLRRRLERHRQMASLASSIDTLAAFENEIAVLEELIDLVRRRRDPGLENTGGSRT